MLQTLAGLRGKLRSNLPLAFFSQGVIALKLGRIARIVEWLNSLSQAIIAIIAILAILTI